MKYLIANWKAQMTFSQIQEWTREFRQQIDENSQLKNKLTDNPISIILCPPHPFILYVKDQLHDYPFIKIGAQDISTIEEGKFTGEVTAKALQGIIDYSIIGHSERRSNFGETEKHIEQKIQQCQKYNIEPILCVRDEKDSMYPAVKILAFEPVSAIGTGKNMDPLQVIEMKKKLAVSPENSFLYGGSADETNCAGYYKTGEIDGFLVGNASLNPTKFFEMAHNIV